MFLKLEFFLKEMKCEAGDNRDHLALMLIPRPDKPELRPAASMLCALGKLTAPPEPHSP